MDSILQVEALLWTTNHRTKLIMMFLNSSFYSPQIVCKKETNYVMAHFLIFGDSDLGDNIYHSMLAQSKISNFYISKLKKISYRYFGIHTDLQFSKVFQAHR